MRPTRNLPSLIAVAVHAPQSHLSICLPLPCCILCKRRKTGPRVNKVCTDSTRTASRDRVRQPLIFRRGIVKLIDPVVHCRSSSSNRSSSSSGLCSGAALFALALLLL